MTFVKVAVKGGPLNATEHDANWTEAQTRLAALEAGGAVDLTIDSNVTGTVWTLTINGEEFVHTIPASSYAPPGVVAFSAATMTLGTSNKHQHIRCTHVDGCVVTVPPQASVNFSGNPEIRFVQTVEDAFVTFVAGTDVVINARAGLADGTTEQWQVVTLKRVASNVWDLY